MQINAVFVSAHWYLNCQQRCGLSASQTLQISMFVTVCFSEVPPSPGLEKKSSTYPLEVIKLWKLACPTAMVLLESFCSCSPNINCQRSNLSAILISVTWTCLYRTFPKSQNSLIFFKHWKSQNLPFPYQKWFSVMLKVSPSNRCHRRGHSAGVSNVTKNKNI